MLSKELILVGGFLADDIEIFSKFLSQNKSLRILDSSEILINVTGTNHMHRVEQLRSIIDDKLSVVNQEVAISFDETWNYPQNVNVMVDICFDIPHLIYILRPIHECISIMFKKSKFSNISEFMKSVDYVSTLKQYYQSIYIISNLYKDNVFLIDAHEFKTNPYEVLLKLTTKINIPKSKYKTAILSNIKSEVNLLDDNVLSYNQQLYWKQGNPKPIPVNSHYEDMLDLSLAHNLRGESYTAEQNLNFFLSKYPNNNRGLYNKGIFTIKHNLLEGHKYLTKGRSENVYGSKPPILGLPEWNGETNCTVLFFLEGGLGDEIHFVRFVKNIRAYGCEVITCCNKSLKEVFKYVDGIGEVIDRTELQYYHFDYYVPAMSCIINLKLQYSDITGNSYINIPFKDTPNFGKQRIGLRWRGNPQFEHEQHRLFPSELLFNAVNGIDAQFISLQKDIGSEETPSWVEKVNLDTWMDTARAINSCNLVITSCTSVAHLAGAMGKKTYIVIPLLPYFVWAPEGDKTLFYDNVRLFRQTVFQSWKEPFTNLKQVLENEIGYNFKNT